MTDELVAVEALLDTVQAKFSDAALAYSEAPPGKARAAALSRWNEVHTEFSRVLATYHDLIEKQEEQES